LHAAGKRFPGTCAKLPGPWGIVFGACAKLFFLHFFNKKGEFIDDFMLKYIP